MRSDLRKSRLSGFCGSMRRVVNPGKLEILGKGAIVKVVDIGAIGHFLPLASPPRGLVQRIMEKEPGSCC